MKISVSAKNLFYGGLVCNHAGKTTIKNSKVDGVVELNGVAGGNVTVGLYIENCNTATSLLEKNTHGITSFKVNGIEVLSEVVTATGDNKSYSSCGKSYTK